MTSDGYYITDVSTEWESALAKHKIREKKHREVAQDTIDTKAYWEQTEINKHQNENKTIKELDEMQDEIEERELLELRRKRRQKIIAERKANKFGRIKHISKPDYVKEVTESSVEQPVICCLYVDGQESSQIMLKCLESLAEKFPKCKFCKIIGRECIPNYKDSYCPTLVIYKNGDPVGNIKGLYAYGGKKVINADIVEWEIASATAIWKCTLEENPRKFIMKRLLSGKRVQKTNINSNKWGIEKVEESDSDSLDI